MNVKKFQLFLVLILVLAFTTAFTTLPAPIADPIRDPDALQCYLTQRTAAGIDIPSRWSDYQLLDQAAGCGTRQAN